MTIRDPRDCATPECGTPVLLLGTDCTPRLPHFRPTRMVHKASLSGGWALWQCPACKNVEVLVEDE